MLAYEVDGGGTPLCTPCGRRSHSTPLSPPPPSPASPLPRPCLTSAEPDGGALRSMLRRLSSSLRRRLSSAVRAAASGVLWSNRSTISSLQRAYSPSYACKCCAT